MNFSCSILSNQPMEDYNNMKQKMSRKFYKFIDEYCHEFLQTNSYQYIIVPFTLLQEFHMYVKDTNVLPIYQEKGNYHFIDPPMNPSFLSFCQIHASQQEIKVKYFFQK